MVSERVDEPRRRDVHSECLPIVTFPIEDLANKRFSSGHVDVGHDVHTQDELQPSLGYEFAKGPCLFRVPFQEWLDVSDLVEDEPVTGLGFQEMKGFKNI